MNDRKEAERQLSMRRDLSAQLARAIEAQRPEFEVEVMHPAGRIDGPTLTRMLADTLVEVANPRANTRRNPERAEIEIRMHVGRYEITSVYSEEAMLDRRDAMMVALREMRAQARKLCEAVAFGTGPLDPVAETVRLLHHWPDPTEAAVILDLLEDMRGEAVRKVREEMAG